MWLGEVQSCDRRTGVAAKCLRTSWFPCLFSRTIFAVHRKETWYKRHVVPTAYAYRRNHDRRWQLFDHDGYMGSQTPSIAQTAGKYFRCVLFVTTASYIPLSSGASTPSIKQHRNVARKAACVALTEKPVGVSGRIQK